MSHRESRKHMTALGFALFLLMPPVTALGQEGEDARQAPPRPPGRHGMMGGDSGMMKSGGMGMMQGGGMGMMQGGMGMHGGAMGMMGGAMGMQAGVPDEKDFECWRENLGLSAEQLSSLKEIYRGLRKDHIMERAKMQSAEVDLQTLLDADKVDLGKAEKVLKEIEGHRTSLRMGHIASWEKAKGVLTEEQRKKMEALPGGPAPMGRQPCPAVSGTAPDSPMGGGGEMPGGHGM